MVALVALSQIVASPGALERAGQSPAFFLARHAGRDWDELDPNRHRRERLQHGT